MPSLYSFGGIFLVGLMLFIFIFWKYYWKAQLLFNRSSMSLYTPSSFQISSGTEHEIDMREIAGASHAKNSRVVIISMLRDAEKRMPLIKQKVEAIGNLFRKYHVLIVENDSTDKTRDLLLQWTKQNPSITILGCGHNAATCKLSFEKTEGHGVDRNRIEKMTKLRNIYLEELKKNYSDCDYAIIADFDIIGTTYLDGIANTMSHFEEDVNLSAICAYGIYEWAFMNIYYDTYAHQDVGEGDFHIDLKTAHDIRKGLSIKHSRGEPLVDVKSCFSGFTIYRVAALLPANVKYDMSSEENLECEHSRMHKYIKGRIAMNPSMINLVLRNE
jgi:hypothetical protein